MSWKQVAFVIATLVIGKISFPFIKKFFAKPPSLPPNQQKLSAPELQQDNLLKFCQSLSKEISKPLIIGNNNEVSKQLNEWMKDHALELCKIEKLSLFSSVPPAQILQLTNLKELTVAYCGLERCPKEIFQLQQLEKLELSNNNFKILPKEIHQLQNLKILSLNCNKFESFPQEMLQLPKLENFSFSKEKFGCFPKEIFQFRQLKVLSFCLSNLEALPKEIIQLQNLETLNISYNHLRDIPEEIFQLPQLAFLILLNNKITALSEKVIQLKNLKILHLKFNKLNEVPKEIFQIQSLEKLELSYNQLTTLPEDVSPNKNLQNLYLDGNQLTTLPQWISQLQNLKNLNLSHNFFNRIPLFLAQLQNLETLYLSANHLRDIPEEIFQIQSLEKLELSYNQLTTLPEDVSPNNNLQNLHLDNNQLTTFPQWITQLQNLKNFNLTHNRFNRIPLFLAQLPATCKIDLSDNPLTPEAIIEFQEEIARVQQGNPQLGPQFTANITDNSNSGTTEVSLEDNLLFWLGEYQTQFSGLTADKSDRFPGASSNPRACLEFYKPVTEHEKASTLNAYLSKIKRTQDFRVGGSAKTAMIYATGRMLEKIAIHVEFWDKIIPILEEATSNCGDRGAIYASKVELALRFANADELNEMDLAKLTVGSKRIDLIENRYAPQRIKERRLGDPVEVYLYYECKLKDRLVLPISTEDMLYKKVGEIPDADLEADAQAILKQTTSEKDIIEILVQQDDWQDRMIKVYKPQFDQIYREKFKSRFDQYNDDLLNPECPEKGQIAAQMKELEKQIESEKREFVQRMTATWVHENWKELSSQTNPKN